MYSAADHHINVADDVGHNLQGAEASAPRHSNKDRLEQDHQLLHWQGAQKHLELPVVHIV